MSDYTGRIQRHVVSKDGARVQWYVSLTHPDWTAGVDGIGVGTLLHRGDSPQWVQAKRDNLRASLLAHAEDNQLSTTGLDDYLRAFLQGVQP